MFVIFKINFIFTTTWIAVFVVRIGTGALFLFFRFAKEVKTPVVASSFQTHHRVFDRGKKHPESLKKQDIRGLGFEGRLGIKIPLMGSKTVFMFSCLYRVSPFNIQTHILYLQFLW